MNNNHIKKFTVENTQNTDDDGNTALWKYAGMLEGEQNSSKCLSIRCH
jgi:hypothetical protein